MIEEPLTVRLELESQPENVALVRSALSGIAEAVHLSPEITADLKTAISEACNNVALHAYDDTSGPMLVEIDGSSDGICATVTDHGRGITRISGGEDRMGLGLAVISALADTSEFRHPAGGGTEVRMWFATASDELDLGPSTPEGQPRRLPDPPHREDRYDEEIVAFFAPAAMTRYVLGRLMQSLAASSHFSITAISDLRAANDAISGYIEGASADGVSLALSSSAHRLSMITGRLPDHDLPSARAALGSVVDSVDGEAEGLRIELLDHGRDAA